MKVRFMFAQVDASGEPTNRMVVVDGKKLIVDCTQQEAKAVASAAGWFATPVYRNFDAELLSLMTETGLTLRVCPVSVRIFASFCRGLVDVYSVEGISFPIAVAKLIKWQGDVPDFTCTKLEKYLIENGGDLIISFDEMWVMTHRTTAVTGDTLSNVFKKMEERLTNG